MAVDMALCTHSPLQFTADCDVLAEDVLDVAKESNWVAGKRPRTHLAIDAGEKEFTGSSVVVRRGDIITDAEVQTLVCGAVIQISGGDTADVVFTIDGVSKTISFAAADDDTEKTATFSVAGDLGGASGQLAWTISIQRTAGAGTPTLSCATIQEGTIAGADLPAPAND